MNKEAEKYNKHVEKNLEDFLRRNELNTKQFYVVQDVCEKLIEEIQKLGKKHKVKELEKLDHINEEIIRLD